MPSHAILWAVTTPSPVLVYHPRYNMRAMGLERLHPFDTRKHERAMALLLPEAKIPAARILRPAPARRRDLLQVHSPEYLRQLHSPAYLARALEIPFIAKLPALVTRRLVLGPMRYATGGTLLAATTALQCGLATNLAGGFHHASRTRAEGFCVFADIALAITRLRAQRRIDTAIVIDLDAHQGNGVERDFTGDPGVAIFDIYNMNIYPGDADAKRGIRWNLPIETGTGDAQYLGLLRQALPRALDAFPADLAIYNAGTDIVRGDPLGLLSVSPDAVLARDQFVLEQLAQRNIPTVMLTSGGYTDQSHSLIARTVAWAFERWPAQPS